MDLFCQTGLIAKIRGFEFELNLTPRKPFFFECRRNMEAIFFWKGNFLTINIGRLLIYLPPLSGS